MTAAPTSLLSSIASTMASSSGPELPMQVVQPYPTVSNPIASRSAVRPDLLRYSVTTCDPGASEVFTQGFGFSPLACALRATSPAATSTDGFDVFVQEVIAAITTSPWVSSKFFPSTLTDR